MLSLGWKWVSRRVGLWMNDWSKASWQEGGRKSFTMNNNPKQDSKHMLNEPGEKEKERCTASHNAAAKWEFIELWKPCLHCLMWSTPIGDQNRTLMRKEKRWPRFLRKSGWMSKPTERRPAQRDKVKNSPGLAVKLLKVAEWALSENNSVWSTFLKQSLVASQL